MIELPESATLARQLHGTVLGKEIAAVQTAQSPHGFAWYHGDAALYPRLLVGRQITDAFPVSGILEIAAQDTHIALNDGVNLRFFSSPTEIPKKHQLLITFTDGTGLYCTVQMYGGMMAFPAGAYENPYYQVARDRPSPLSAAFDEGYFADLLSTAPVKLSAKALLATEQRIPGLGNGCVQDILFFAGINPQTKLSSLTSADHSALFFSIKNTLASMTRLGGRDTEKDLFGHPGGYPTTLSAKTLPYPCPKCGGGILRKAYLGGNVYFCPACQPILN